MDQLWAEHRIEELETWIRELVKKKEGLVSQYGLEHPELVSINKRLRRYKIRLERVRLKPHQASFL
jgi:hypothetical protein